MHAFDAPPWHGKATAAVAAAALLCIAQLAGCGSKPQADALRTVTSYEASSCVSAPTTDPLQLEAIAHFNSEVREKYFVTDRGSLTAANHERSNDESGLRQYRGPFYTYVHPQPVTPGERALGIDWNGVIFLHAESIRARRNSEPWSDWQRVRTRNFADQKRGVEGLRRWMCLINAEIAWAELQHDRSGWQVTPSTVSLYERQELQRLLPLPTAGQIEGNDVEAGAP